MQSIEVLATTNEHPPRVANFATHRWPWDLAARAIHATAGWKPGFLGSVAAVKKQNGKTGLGMWEQKTGVIPYNARPTGTSAQMIGSRSDWRVGVLDVPPPFEKEQLTPWCQIYHFVLYLQQLELQNLLAPQANYELSTTEEVQFTTHTFSPQLLVQGLKSLTCKSNGEEKRIQPNRQRPLKQGTGTFSSAGAIGNDRHQGRSQRRRPKQGTHTVPPYEAPCAPSLWPPWALPKQISPAPTPGETRRVVEGSVGTRSVSLRHDPLDPLTRIPK